MRRIAILCRIVGDRNEACEYRRVSCEAVFSGLCYDIDVWRVRVFWELNVLRFRRPFGAGM